MLCLAFPVEASQLEIQRVEHLRLLLGGNSLTLCSPGCSRDCCHPSGNTQLCWNVGCTGPPGCRCLHTTPARNAKTAISVSFNQNLLYKAVTSCLEWEMVGFYSNNSGHCELNGSHIKATRQQETFMFYEVVLVLTKPNRITI